MKYLEKSKRYFNRKWTQRYFEYKKCSKKWIKSTPDIFWSVFFIYKFY
jgi:hypothetical protein